MGKDPDQIRQEIEQTRAELGQNLDVLTEKVSPTRVVERRVDATKQAVTGAKDRVMGVFADATDTVSERSGGVSAKASDALAGAKDSVSGAGQSVAGTVSAAPQQAKARATGNPLAAGLIAFGVGWLASSLVPASSREQDAATRLKESAGSLAEPVKQQLAQAASEVKESIQPQAQEAVQAVKETATDAAAEVQGHAQEAVGTVTKQSQGSAQAVKEHAADAKDTVTEQATAGGPGSSAGADETSTFAVPPTSTGYDLPAAAPAVPVSADPPLTEEERRLGELRGPGSS